MIHKGTETRLRIRPDAYTALRAPASGPAVTRQKTEAGKPGAAAA